MPVIGHKWINARYIKNGWVILGFLSNSDHIRSKKSIMIGACQSHFSNLKIGHKIIPNTTAQK